MKRAALAFGLTGALVQLLLVFHGLDAVHAAVRVLLAAAVLVLLPGEAIRRILGVAPPGGSALAVGWSFCLGLAWTACLVWLMAAMGLAVPHLASWALPGTLLLWGIVAKAPAVHAQQPSLGRGWIYLVFVAAAVGAVYAGVMGAPLMLSSDSPDHIATIRRIMETGNAFPSDAFFANAGAGGVDPRKGLWHGVVAVIGILAGTDAVLVWRHLPTLLTPLLVLNAAVLGWMIARGPGAAVAAWGILLTYGGSLASTPIRETVYSAKLSDHLSLVAAIAVMTDLGIATRRSRAAAVVIAIAAAATHVFAFVQLSLVLAALTVALLIRDRAISASVRRLATTGSFVVAACTPFLVWQLLRTPEPLNVIHTEPQGLLLLPGAGAIVAPGVIWTWLGIAWILFPLLAIPLWRHARNNVAALYALTTAAAVAVVTLNPIAVALLEPRIGYLLMRFIWMVPLWALLAWAIPWLVSNFARRGVSLGKAAMAAAIIAVLVPPLSDAAGVAASIARAKADERDRGAAPWASMLYWLRDSLPETTVVLSDPQTSYSIPMWSGRHVVTLVDQHSSPSDGAALDRILGARDALDPSGSWDDLRNVVKRWDANVIVLNGRFESAPRLDYWAPSAEWYERAKRRLDARPDAFPVLRDTSRLTVYAINRDVLDTLSVPPPVPRDYLRRIEKGGSAAWTLGPGLPNVRKVELDASSFAPGDTLRGTIIWEVDEPAQPGSYRVAVRFDRRLPAALRAPRGFEKPVRKVRERLAGERYRFRADHLPAEGFYGVDLWPRGAVVVDPFQLTVPHDVAAGEYSVQVQMVRQAHYPNLRLADYFSDTDYFSGPVVGTVEVRRRERPATSH